MKKIPNIINRLLNVCGQMVVGALLNCGSGIKIIKAILKRHSPHRAAGVKNGEVRLTFSFFSLKAWVVV